MNSLEAGRTLAGYRITRELARGGMGVVYEAEHVRLGRTAVLKLLAPQLADDEAFRERFVQESRLVAAIEHPGIVPIYDAGEVDGLLYIAMRYVDGDDLKTLLAAGPLAPERACAIVEQAAAALDAVHERDLVHRDVKPANFLVERASGRVFLTDFGLARRRARGTTQEGLFLGTVGYAPPEQIKGDPVTAATDVYALGCVLCECLTGKPPFDKETDVAVVYAHLRDEPPRVTERRPELPAAFDSVIATALAKSPEDRYHSCGELAAAARGALGAAARPVPATVVRPQAPAPYRLPEPPTAIVGRSGELEQAHALLGRADVRLLTFIGPGGTGKTRLAIETAAGSEEEFPDGRVFVALDAVAAPELVAPTIADALGVQEREPLREALQARLHGRRLLLVLDNFEHVQAAAPLVAELLAAASTFKVLVTSRGPLHLRGEHVLPVPPLELPGPAVALFLERARAVRPDLELDGEGTRAVEAICARLDGLPLAIELVAPRVKLLSPAALRERLEQDPALASGGARDLPSRHRTLQGAIEWSFDLLGPDEQSLFARLGVFPGGCTLEAAEAVCGGRGVLEALEALLDESLVRERAGGDGGLRFEMLQTIQEYARYRLLERGEGDELRRRQAEYFLALVEAAEPELSGPGQSAWVRRLEDETANVRAALAWSLESGDLETGLRVAGALARFWSIRDQLTEGRLWLEQALAVRRPVAPPVRAKALFAAGYSALGQGDYAYASARLEESADLYRELGDEQAAAMCGAQLGWLLMARGELAQATAASEESLAAARRLGDDRTASVALATLGDVAAQEGDYARAGELHAECLALRRRLGDRRTTANALLNLARVDVLEGRYDRALTASEEGLELAREVGDTWGSSVALANLGRIALARGQHERAQAFLAEALESCWRRGDKRIAAECLQALAGLAAAEGEGARAARLWGAAEAVRALAAAPLSPTERAIEADYLAPLADGAASEREAGRALGFDDAVAEALTRTAAPRAR